jgi:hypothetical protein
VWDDGAPHTNWGRALPAIGVRKLVSFPKMGSYENASKIFEIASVNNMCEKEGMYYCGNHTPKTKNMCKKQRAKIK